MLQVAVPPGFVTPLAAHWSASDNALALELGAAALKKLNTTRKWVRRIVNT